ncbi:MAG: ribosome-binding factor A [Rhodospirillaceae bacterium]|nr:ribosome-binding factor A [Rhodospirillaceae bacterium]|tara:strand:+ start:8251 stop:8685 length:435 start_codon:yes stop_codon:yes gene_type:complete
MANQREGGPRAGRERTQRQLRVGELIRHALVETITRGELRDPDLAGVSITISEVRVSPDLKNATAFVMPLGGKEVSKIVSALKRAAPFLRRQVGAIASMRYMPALSFVADEAFDEADKIESLLRSQKIKQDISSADAEGTGGKN